MAVPLTSSTYDLDLVVAFLLATVQCVSLPLALFRPVLGSALQLGSVIALALATRDSGGDPWPLPLTGLISLGALILVLGIRQRWVFSVGTWWISITALIVVIVSSPDRYANPDEWGTNLTIYATYTLTVLAAAVALGQRRRIRDDLARARRDIELEQAQRRYVEERARIARELHDVVAHSMSLIHMQALSAPQRLSVTATAEVTREFQAIAGAARATLAEMRQLLGALRPDDGAELAPQPQLADLTDLAGATTRAGTGVDVHLDVDPVALAASPIVQLTIYRIVQEALSNVVRHAPGSTASAAVEVSGTSLQVSVRNTPPPPRSTRHAASPDSGGHGLRGMRERVSLLGGHLSTASTAEGGYAVEASIPAVIDRQSEQR